MQNEKKFYFEPMRIRTTPTIGRVVSRDTRLPIRKRISHRDGYFLRKVITENKEEFESINFEEDVSKTAVREIEKYKGEVKNKFAKILPSEDITKNLPPTEELILINLERENPFRFSFHKKSSSVIIPLHSTLFYVLSRTKEEAKKLVEYLRSKFMELSEITKDFDLKIDEILIGREFQEHILKRVENIRDISYGEPRNDFEREVIDVCNNLMNSFLSNVNVSFEKPPENFEFDIFIGLTNKRKLIIEPTNYETIKKEKTAGESLKSSLILKTLDKARRLGAESIVITKDVPTEIFNSIKEMADSRGILLLNEGNYKTGVYDQILANIMYSL